MHVNRHFHREGVMFSGRFDNGPKERLIRGVADNLILRGVQVNIVRANAGDQFGPLTMRYLATSQVVVAFCYENYGEKTASPYSTYGEVKYCIDHKADIKIIPIKLYEGSWPPSPDIDGEIQNQFLFSDDLIRLDCTETSHDVERVSDLLYAHLEGLVSLRTKIKDRAVDVAPPQISEDNARAAWSVHRGYLASGDDIRSEHMTLEDAKAKCFQLEGCAGFTYAGTPDSLEPQDIYFKTKWDFVESDEWTSVKVEKAVDRETTHVGFSAHGGYLAAGNDLFGDWMTIAAAREKAAELDGCAGFTFEGTEDSSEQVYARFKGKWEFVETSGWTSIKVEHCELD